MKKTFAIVLTAALALAACGNKNKNTATTPKTDAKSGSMGGATYGTPATGGTTPTPPAPTGGTATPNPCGAGM
jgi:hypothetical protein